MVRTLASSVVWSETFQLDLRVLFLGVRAASHARNKLSVKRVALFLSNSRTAESNPSCRYLALQPSAAKRKRDANRCLTTSPRWSGQETPTTKYVLRRSAKIRRGFGFHKVRPLWLAACCRSFSSRLTSIIRWARREMAIGWVSR